MTAINTSPTAPGKPKGPQKLARDRRLGTYIEYDLSKMANTKGVEYQVKAFERIRWAYARWLK